jgi:hypothetical protein
MAAGISGALLSSAFVDRRVPSMLGAMDDRAGTAARALPGWWRSVCQQHGPTSSLRALCDLVVAPLAHLLGYSLVQPSRLSDDFWYATFEADDVRLPAAIVPWAAPLDGAWRDAIRVGLASSVHWVLLINATQARLIDGRPGAARRSIDFDFATVADDEASADAFVQLLAPARFTASGHASGLASLVAASDGEGRRVCEALRRGVAVALEHVINGLVPRRPHRAGVLESAYGEALTAVYRILFLLFAEARGLVPTWHPIYSDAYTIEALRGAAEGGRGTGLWEAFQAISRMAHRGCDAGDLQVTAFNGRLFAPSRSPRLDTVMLDDRSIRDAVLALTTAPAPDGQGRERIAYGDLGVEELGSIYETLLDVEPRMPDEAPIGRGPRRRIVLARSRVDRRKETGSFYTPEPLTRFLVRQTLDPMTRSSSSDAILRLRVVDPAMGSGAFLVAACRFLAARYEAALVREGACHPADVSDDDRAGFRRLVAQRCLFGVDANPVAVQLARLSLWLTTLAANRPLGFLDHRLACGDSILGAMSLADLLDGGRNGGRAPASDRQLLLPEAQAWRDALRSWLPVRERLASTDDRTAADIRAKELVMAGLVASEGWQQTKTVCDLWCALTTESSPRRAELEALASHLLYGRSVLPESAARGRLDRALQAAAALGPFHWTIEFPEIFCDEHGRDRFDGGFDAVLGNPPWEMLRADAAGANRRRLEARVRFTRRAGRFHAQSTGHVNEYQLFVERAIRLVRQRGRIGLVLPHGLASDHGAAPLRRLLLDQCDTDVIVGFENRAGVFPIHRSVRFLLLTSSRGGSTVQTRCRFGLTDPAALDALSESPTAVAFPITVTPALLRRISGDDLQIPDLRTPLDLEILEMMTARHPALASADGWGASFGRELNATDDRPHFSEQRAGLPVIEGKHVGPFVVRAEDATFHVPRDVAARLLDPRRTFGRARLGFRDVASSTNRTTLIAAVIPRGCVTTHTVFCLRTPLVPVDQWLLCALLNSFVANYLIRPRVSSHVSVSTIAHLPVPRPYRDSAIARELAACARWLSRRAAGAAAIHARLQALAAAVYDVTTEQYRHVLSTFPLVPESERAAAFNAFVQDGTR